MTKFLMCYGPEFSAAPFQDWLMRVGIQPIRMYPGSPWENGYNERFNGTLRRDVLNAEWFTTTRQAQPSSTSGSDSTITSARITRSACAHRCPKRYLRKATSVAQTKGAGQRTRN